jgi:hypothetical protein
MGLSKALQTVASKVSKSLGGAAVLRKSSSTYDPATGQTTTTTTDYTVYVSYEEYSDHLVDGTAIQTTDRKALFSAGDLPSGVAPAQNDKLIEGGKTMTVVRVRPTEVQGSAVTYQLQVRA